MIQLYLQAVLSSAVTSRRAPVMYLIAVHHINRFIYLRTGVQQQQQTSYWMLTRIMRLQDEVRT